MNATAPVNSDTDLDDIRHLDPSTPCTIGVTVQLRGADDPAAVGSRMCPNAAAWDMTCRKCEATSPVCDDHKSAASRAERGHCRRCGTVGRPSRNFLFTRLGGHQ
ncbi:hypothetical protein ACFVTX_18070 [Agromyces sp. NPDC058136]|uniref:hypothetical protein n=1 Tax=Agromyces sp. NPDC058136 TaxID=3346354 RepID=UPI0036DA8C1A